MAIFGNNSLRPEEKVGGFESGVDGTGLFSLNEMEEYPGILPNFEFEDQSVTSIIFEKEGKDFTFKPQKIELTPQDKVKPIINLNLDKKEEQIDIEGESFFKQSKTELGESELSNYKNNFDKDTFDEEYGDDKYDFTKEENLDNRFNVSKDDNEYVDDELKSILEGSIGRKDVKKSKPTLDDLRYDEVSGKDEADKLNNDNNEAIDELKNETMDSFFDFSSINADKPSQFNSGDEEIKSEEELEEKKKRKKTPLWLFSLYLFAGALVLTAILGLVFWKVINKKFNFDGKQDSTKLEKVITLPVIKNKKEYPEKKSRHTELVAENDDVKVELKVEIKPEKESDTSHGDSHSNGDDNSHGKVKDNKLDLHSTDEKTKIETKITFKDKKEKTKSIDNKVAHSSAHSKDHSSDNIGQKEDSHSFSKDNAKKEIKIDVKNPIDNSKFSIKKDNYLEEEKKTESLRDIKKDKIDKSDKSDKVYNNNSDKSEKSEKSKDLAKTNNIENKIKSETYIDSNKNENVEDDKPEYSVQIYSSLSKADAQDMLKKLNSYGVNDGFIITQTVRDELWYRVRYGKFNSKDEAKNNASKYGFNQIWIDRVK